MQHRTLLWFLPFLGACGGRPQNSAAQPGLSDAPGEQAAAAMTGTWALRALNRDRVGRQLAIALDSASGRSFRARVTFYMQGDVGLDAAQFLPTPGVITADGAIRIEIRNARGAPPGLIAGTVAGDTVHVAEFSWNGENQLAGGTKWALVRER